MSTVAAGARLGRYRLQRSLGRGGEGEVFLALDAETGRRVAVKVIRDRLSRDAAVRARREATVLASLKHPNIVDVFSVGHQDHVWYLAMEWVGGGNMTERVEQHGPLSEPHALQLVADAAAGLGAAHRLGVLHCDVNPKNMLFDEHTKSLRLVDFGLSVLPQRDTGPTRLAGTPQYIAPEMWSGGEASTKVDVYALALSLHYLLTGQHAIKASDVATCKAAHTLGVKPPTHWSKPTAQLFRDAAAVDPTRRLSMQDMLTRTLRVLSSLRTAPPEPEGPPHDLRAWVEALCAEVLPPPALVTADAVVMLMEAAEANPSQARTLLLRADQIRAQLNDRCLSTAHLVRLKHARKGSTDTTRRWPDAVTLADTARLRRRYGSVGPLWLKS